MSSIDLEPVLAHFTEKIGGDRSLLPAHGESLVDEGILDSFGLAELVSVIEAAYEVKVPDEDIALTTFDTVDKIVAWVSAQKAS